MPCDERSWVNFPTPQQEREERAREWITFFQVAALVICLTPYNWARQAAVDLRGWWRQPRRRG